MNLLKSFLFSINCFDKKILNKLRTMFVQTNNVKVSKRKTI